MSLLSVRPTQSLFSKQSSYETAGSLASAGSSKGASVFSSYETAGSLASSGVSSGSSSGSSVSCLA